MMKNCGICNRPCTEHLLETHHMVPRGLNGSDDSTNLIDICPICHTSTHVLARLIKKSKVEAENFLASNFAGNKQAQEMLVKLAKVIILEEETAGPKEFVNVMYRPSMEIHKKLREMTKESKTNMLNLLDTLIEKEWRARKFGVNRPNLQRIK